ncbi:PREDICTED: olfactory receptor 5AC1-like [Cyprinodon variegatus]|uniref:olfactory receptor 5AC1-like n=1 Tax=Cyprinodon variegatus TaxID=28743 RepID=UPI000742A7A0|nr:PREDICTED: olfactory receptor 5AC1-like [Cyprinodon variegatus]
MNNDMNVTYILLDGYVEMSKYKYVYFLIMFSAYILIICSNLTIVYLIWVNKNLHEPMYVFIAALLVNCVFYSTATYPKLLIDFLSEKQKITYQACLLQFYFFYFVGPAEFFLLAAMSYDRYVSICRPLLYPTIMTNTTVTVFLVFSWFIPACHASIPLIMLSSTKVKLCNFNIKGVFCNNAIYTLQCAMPRSLAIFGVFAILDVVILPILFILFSYTKIMIISYRSCKEVRKKAAETCLPHLLVLFSLTLLSVYDICIVRVESGISKPARLIMTLQIVLYHPLFNPFIYGFKMKEIYKHLKQFFWRVKMLLTKNPQQF